MSTLVLVHGAWHGGWCWQRLVPYLVRQGHSVYTPTLAGLAERAHELRDNPGLSTHIDNVVDLLVSEALEEVVLVGHSYAGMVITGVAEHASERIQRLVYLDALVPEHGQSMFDYVPYMEAGIRSLASDQGGIEIARPVSPQVWGVTDPNDAEWIASQLTAQPMRCATEKLDAPARLASRLPRTYILISELGRAAYTSAAADDGWTRFESLCGHEAMITHPEQVASALSKCT